MHTHIYRWIAIKTVKQGIWSTLRYSTVCFIYTLQLHAYRPVYVAAHVINIWFNNQIKRSSASTSGRHWLSSPWQVSLRLSSSWQWITFQFLNFYIWHILLEDTLRALCCNSKADSTVATVAWNNCIMTIGCNLGLIIEGALQVSFCHLQNYTICLCYSGTLYSQHLLWLQEQNQVDSVAHQRQGHQRWGLLAYKTTALKKSVHNVNFTQVSLAIVFRLHFEATLSRLRGLCKGRHGSSGFPFHSPLSGDRNVM